MDSPQPPDGASPPLPVVGGSGADSLIEVLHRVQKPRGWLDSRTLLQVARQLRLPLSHVQGVASFYHLFLLQQPAPHRCAVCLGTACFVRGGLQLADLLAARLAVDLDGPWGEGGWSLQRVGCLGACGQAPVLVVDGDLVTRLPLDPALRPLLERRLREAGLPASACPEAT
jgi:bidirectional [NiFe] hydrogenase diaphorase subunit